MSGAAKIPSYATLLENEIAALRKQNDALVAAVERLVDTVDVRASEFSTHSIQFQMSVTKAREALEAAKGKLPPSSCGAEHLPLMANESWS